MVKYDLSFSNICLIYSFTTGDIFHGCWFENDTKILLTTTNNKLKIYDFIEFKESVEKLALS